VIRIYIPFLLVSRGLIFDRSSSTIPRISRKMRGHKGRLAPDPVMRPPCYCSLNQEDGITGGGVDTGTYLTGHMVAPSSCQTPASYPSKRSSKCVIEAPLVNRRSILEPGQKAISLASIAIVRYSDRSSIFNHQWSFFLRRPQFALPSSCLCSMTFEIVSLHHMAALK
jgi:hypothetical protein